MRETLKSIVRPLALLLCGVILLYEAVFTGIGKMFCWIGNKLEKLCRCMMKGLAKGKYEGEMKAIIG